MGVKLNKIDDKNLISKYKDYVIYKRIDEKGDYLHLFVPSMNSTLDDRFRSQDELTTFVDEKL